MLLMSETEDGQHMSDKQVKDEAINIFLAGHDTTSIALTWTWVLLAQHPEIEARLHAEIDAVLGGRPPTLADLPRLKYAEMIVKESLRLYPPSWSLARTAIEDIPIRNGYVVPQGMNIFIAQYVLHHDERWFPDPECFDPERFSPENEPNIPKYAYMPFSYGPRVCIGNMFAMMEAVLVLVTMAQQVKLRIIPGQEPEIDAKLTLNPKRHFKMALVQREMVPDMV
jgi:cytochrome P450